MRVPDLRDWPSSTRIAGAFLLAALALDVLTLIRLRTVRETAPVAPLVIRSAPRIVIHTPDDAELVRAAASSDGGERGDDYLTLNIWAPEQASGRPVMLFIHGGGFVIVEMPDARMQLVRVGEQTGELRLRSVSAGEAIFDDSRGRRVSLRTPAAGAETRP